MSKRWYVVHAYSGFENQVAKALETRIARFEMQDRFGQVLVPTEEVVEMRAGQKRKSERKFFPGYVLVQIETTDEAGIPRIDNESWHLIKETPKVMGFIGELVRAALDEGVEGVAGVEIAGDGLYLGATACDPRRCSGRHGAALPRFCRRVATARGAELQAHVERGAFRVMPQQLGDAWQILVAHRLNDERVGREQTHAALMGLGMQGFDPGVDEL